MSTPPTPTTRLIMIQADFAFSALKTLFNRPSRAGYLGHDFERGLLMRSPYLLNRQALRGLISTSLLKELQVGASQSWTHLSRRRIHMRGHQTPKVVNDNHDTAMIVEFSDEKLQACRLLARRIENCLWKTG